MNNELQIFNNPEFGQVRTVTIDNEPYFVGKDVAEILGYQNGSRDINRHVDEEDRQNYQNGTFESPRGMTVINESGLYSLILSSKLPAAKKFKHWVTSEVLPSILKQNGVDIGQKRLFQWMRDTGYLIKRSGAEYNSPTQRAMEKGLFEIKETVITHADGHTSISKTTKVTGKGQIYFINKFLTAA
jgi:prophage antirepressor|nr:MAG TPA: repressor domain protein [Caudoviricetes sp.]